MATVNGYTAEHTDDVFDQDVVSGAIDGSGHLILTKRNGTTIDSGNVVGPTGPSAANPVPWSKLTAYTTGAIVGYAGVLWKCTANNTGHPPHLFSTEWNPIEGFDYTSQWSAKDSYFIANDFTVAWETFWKTGTSVCSLTTTAGEFETGDQALKVALAVSSSQTLYQKEENIVRGGEVVNVIVRAKLRVAAAGATINAAMFQNDIAGDPAPFGTGSSNTGSNEGIQALTTNWKTYQFTINAVNGKSRAVPYLSLVTGAGAAADILIDRVEFSRNKAQSSTVVNTPVGSILVWPSTQAPPPGWLLCTGAVSRAAYPELFAVIGTTYGAGDGSTTFDLPNFVGRVPVGVYAGYGPTASLGLYGGEFTHVLSAAEMPIHTHAQNVLANGVAGSGQRVDYAGDRAFAGSFPQGVDTGGAGNGAAHNNMQPFTTVNYIIRALPSAGVDRSTTQFFKGSPALNSAVAFAANANMDFTVRTDGSSAWDSVNKRWICQQPGRYRIHAAYEANAASAGRRLRVMKNGSAVAVSPPETANGQLGGVITDVFDLLPGDQIAIQPTAAFTAPAGGAGVENTYVIIETVGLEGTASGMTDSGYINMQLLNGWVNYDSGLSIGGTGRVCRIRKINGIVYLEGVIKTGASGTVAFVLPVGFRPSATTIYERADPSVANGAIAAQVLFNAATGEVAPSGTGVNAYTYLANVGPWIAGG